MKIGLLKDVNGNLSNLANSVSFVTINGREEDVHLTYEKLERIRRTDVLIGRSFLGGERELLSQCTDLLVDLDPLKDIEIKAGKVQVGKFGLCVEGSCVKVSHIIPIRDGVFSEVSVVDLLDLGIMKEVHRVIKKRGVMRLFIRDKSWGGPEPKRVVGYIEAAKFVVMNVKAHGIVWEYVCKSLS
ncbi:hypothetical protein [Sulfuracidifex tepidarius]|uniref:Uncharacterized protein n=1 Tax=Sulfuracidifex tepidarius TaxID=1294262 RepID=A0A510DZP9_9CREN|nr:hypothetical protein [Sulfuracidifex tepidarius]BBG22960.1 hypothetical protein IC006_0244 [Sulfuracidifex tepidarius]BBG25721.1 hypothetical protein IC007_0226 [Sulfuracidifex tepidarius]